MDLLGEFNPALSSVDRAKEFSICFVIILFKVIVTNHLQGIKSAKANKKPQEDYEAFIPRPQQEITQEQLEDEDRYKRIVMNDLECIPYALILFFICVGYYYSEGAHYVFMICVPIYTLCRVLFSVLFIIKLQPYRSIAWAVGQLIVIIMAITLLIETLK